MARPQSEWLEQVEQLARQTDKPEIAILAQAILRLARQTSSQRDNNLSAFEQIEELGRRQEDDDQA